MKLDFSIKMAKYLKDEGQIRKRYGTMAEKIINVISILICSDSLAMVPNVPPTRRHKLKGKFKDCWSIDISENWRLIIKPVENSEILEHIKEIKILDICDYH